MNKDDYLFAIAKDSKWEATNCFYLNLDQIEYTERQEGNDGRLTTKTSDVQLRQELEVTNGNWCPISVHGGPDLFTLDDGHNRVRELKALGYETVKCIMSSYNSPSQRLWGMLCDNIYASCTPASHGDYVAVLVKDIKKNLVLGSKFEVVTKESVKKLLLKNLTAHNKPAPHHKTVTAIVNKVMVELPSGVKKYTNYTSKEDAAGAFSIINPWGLQIAKPGELCKDKDGQEWAVYFAGSEVWVRQNGVHSALNKKKAHPNAKVLLVGFDEKIYQNGGDLAEFREKQQDVAEGINSNPLLNGNLYDRYAVLPQVIQGNAPEKHDELVRWVDFPCN